MFRLIKKIQEKPEHVRKKVSVACALLITLPIVFVWISTFSLHTSSQQAAVGASSPFSLLGNISEDVGDLYGEIKKYFEDVGKFEAVAPPQVEEGGYIRLE